MHVFPGFHQIQVMGKKCLAQGHCNKKLGLSSADQKKNLLTNHAICNLFPSFFDTDLYINLNESYCMKKVV